MTRRPAQGFALALSALLASCATPSQPGADLSGRLALRVAAHDGAPAQNMTTQFELRGNAQAGELRLTTPLGSTAAQARWQPGHAELSSAEGTRRFASLDALAQALLGQSLPLAALIDWLRGRPWPDAPSTAREGGFDQLGWRIDLSQFAQGWVLAARELAPALSVRARLDRPE